PVLLGELHPGRRLGHARRTALVLTEPARSPIRLRRAMEPSALLRGTLDLLILKAASLGPLHGYGILLRVQQITGNALAIEQGALYPALYRLEHRGLLDGEWGVSDNNRRARFYKLTAAGRRRLREETDSWNQMAAAMAAALGASASDI